MPGGAAQDIPEPGKLLLVKLGSIGDVVETLPLANRLRVGLPGTEIGWVIEPKSYPLIESHPAVDRPILFRRGGGTAALREAVSRIREFSPDLVIDAQRILRSSLFTVLSGAPRRLGFDRARTKEGSWMFTNRKLPPRPGSRHMVLQYLEFADYLGIPASAPVFGLTVAEEATTAAARLLEGMGGRYLVFNIGAAKPANRWPIRHWAELAREASSRTGMPIAVTGGAADGAAAAELAKTLPPAIPLKNLAGATSLAELVAVLAGAGAVVSGDTGPMHIASALGVPTLGLFGPADPGRTGPFNHLDLVVRSPAPCSPCGRRSCPRDDCMAAISPGRVWKELAAALERGRER
ncbi:MAG TPA: glycosyltransferase family 9 protein [bacterium]|nr:glycosyltransferase family 9 protein [bacterium]HPQ66223.1 glycosyltransferase family 9 protein [bacterium]